MNFRTSRNSTRAEPILGIAKAPPALDMAELARKIEEDNMALSYAPPAIRNGVTSDEPAVKSITSFGELATKEIDEIIKAAEEEIGELKRQGQLVRDMYTQCTDRISADIKRLREGVRLSMTTMATLREQCINLNEPKVETKDVDGDKVSATPSGTAREAADPEC